MIAFVSYLIVLVLSTSNVSQVICPEGQLLLSTCPIAGLLKEQMHTNGRAGAIISLLLEKAKAVQSLCAAVLLGVFILHSLLVLSCGFLRLTFVSASHVFDSAIGRLAASGFQELPTLRIILARLLHHGLAQVLRCSLNGGPAGIGVCLVSVPFASHLLSVGRATGAVAVGRRCEGR